MTFNPLITSAGPQPTPPATLLAALLTLVTSTNPGYTANLPGSLVEDISSTDVGALVTCDSAAVDLLNSIAPSTANPYLLTLLGNIYGVQLGLATNTSVFVQFSGPAGFVVAQGFTVSDGTYQYVVQDGGVIATGGVSSQLFALATITGSWAVPTGTVTQIVTSLPSGVNVTVTNPVPGVPGTAAETEENYRARVLAAGLAVAQGFPTFLKTILGGVSGVQTRLVSVLQQTGGGWEVIVGGGDPYAVAYAIYTALFDVSTLVGSVLAISGITQANPGVVTTVNNHGYTTGQVAVATGIVGMTELNGVDMTLTVLTEKTFSIGINTSGFTTYVSGGVLTPNLRNQTVAIDDFPDVYQVTFVEPPQQTVAITVTWNTTSNNFVNPAAFAQLVQPALADYVNGIVVGQPMNLFVMDAVVQAAVASILSPAQLTRLVFSVSINGVGTSPSAGTGIVAGDPESYFFTTPSAITAVQG